MKFIGPLEHAAKQAHKELQPNEYRENSSALDSSEKTAHHRTVVPVYELACPFGRGPGRLPVDRYMSCKLTMIIDKTNGTTKVWYCTNHALQLVTGEVLTLFGRFMYPHNEDYGD